MTNIARFPANGKADPGGKPVSGPGDDGKRLRGPARCIECRHEWEAVAPVGTYELQCPQCESMKGMYIWPVGEEDEKWICHCGSDAFKVLRAEIICYRCGTDQRF